MMRELVQEEILPLVEKPSRYLGTEYNAVHKEWERTPVRMVLAFPDLYEIGMSHLGLAILYGLVNEEQHFLLERVFAPAPDMEAQLRRRQVPLFSLESHRPLKSFDILGFTLQYELNYTNILNMLHLAGIPLLASERGEDDPLVIGGGPCTVNPEPLVDFFDAFTLGDGEEILPRMLSLIKKFKEEQADAGTGRSRLGAMRQQVLYRLARLEGVYVPSLYEVSYFSDGRVSAIMPAPGAPAAISRRVVTDLDTAYFPRRPIVPFMEVVHDRVMLEIMRGCSRGCRFCQAGMTYRPVRERSPEVLIKQAEELLKATGHHEIALTSLSSADYTGISGLARTLVDSYGRLGIGLSLPSLRVDKFSVDLAKEIERVRKTGLTFAPEAGTQRLRDVINKGVTEEDLISACRAAFNSGWQGVKLYFMMGLPTERQEDLDGLVDLVYKVLAQKSAGRKARRSVVTVSVAPFVPKPHTPFQWEPQDTVEVLKEKQAYLGKRLADRRVKYRWHNPEMILLEAVLARGDRRLGRAILGAWKNGARFDGWEEYFSWERWAESIEGAGLEPAFYAYRCRLPEEIMPWEHLDMGVSRDFLWQENRRAWEELTTPDCRQAGCTGCSICPRFHVDIQLRGSLATPGKFS